MTVDELREQIAREIHDAYEARFRDAKDGDCAIPWTETHDAWKQDMRLGADRVLAAVAALFTDEQVKEVEWTADSGQHGYLLGTEDWRAMADTLAALRRYASEAA